MRGNTTRFTAVNKCMICDIHLQLVCIMFNLNSIRVFAVGFSFH
jgi:hypothetical protein